MVLNRALGRRIAPQLPDIGQNWKFFPVVDSQTGRTHEPAAVPGGYVFVPASLILSARDEAEFAGMLAHSMVHVSERLWARNSGAIPLVFIGAAGHDEPILLPAGLQQAQRSAELEADRLAVAAMARAGYDPAALLTYIDRLQPAATDPNPLRSAMPSHDERIAGLQAAIQALPPATYSLDNAEFRAVQEEVRRLMPALTDEWPPTRLPTSLRHK